MLEGFTKLMLVVMIGSAAISAFLGGLVGGIIGWLVGWLTAIPLVISIPAGAIAGVALAETLAFRYWYGDRNSHPADEQA